MHRGVCLNLFYFKDEQKTMFGNFVKMIKLNKK